jgi:hypothetical protein
MSAKKRKEIVIDGKSLSFRDDKGHRNRGGKVS